MATELELKLMIQKDHLNLAYDFLNRTCQEQVDCRAEPSLQLMNGYFDTENNTLMQSGIALRIRAVNGRYIQTLKTKGRSVDGLSQRGEWEWFVSGPELDLELLQACDAWPENINLQQLELVFETNFTRCQFDLEWQGSLIELACDQGYVLSQGKREPINEIELELKSGNEQHLHSLAAELQKKLRLAPSDISKAERGYRLYGL